MRLVPVGRGRWRGRRARAQQGGRGAGGAGGRGAGGTLHRVLVALDPTEPALVSLGEEATVLVDVRTHLGLPQHLARKRRGSSACR